MKRPPRFAWAITGSGHYLEESIEIARGLEQVDFFLSKAVEEVLHMYGFGKDLKRKGCRVFRDTTASAVPVGQFYLGEYHTLVIAPATSNTVAKCVVGISDTLVTNVFAQAGKCRIPCIVYACDTAPVVITPAPDREVTVYPRKVDLDSAEALGRFEGTTLARDIDELREAVRQRAECLSTSSS
ncbi:MAG: flavoprotein [Planctomycetes bacterium]|nr:flavoprotein [Planctomycetota bacterium]